jgi:hypothetical protein
MGGIVEIGRTGTLVSVLAVIYFVFYLYYLHVFEILQQSKHVIQAPYEVRS